MGLPQNPTSDKLYVTPTAADGIFVRGGPGLQYNPIASAFIGDALEVLDEPQQAIPKIGQRGQWLKVRTPNGETGWVGARFVQRAYVQPIQETTTPSTAGTATTPSSGTATTTPGEGTTTPASPLKPLYLHTTSENGIYVRSGPGSQFKPLASIMPHQRVEAIGNPADVRARLGKYTEWIQVRTAQGVTGWAAAWYLAEMPEYLICDVGHALAGLHGPAEPWPDKWNEQSYQIISQARVEAVKMLVSGDLLVMGLDYVTNILNRLRGAGVRFILGRLFYKFDEPRTPEQFVNSVAPAARVLFERGIKYFEVHNEPNLHAPGSPEGMWLVWQNGREFGAFFQQAVALLKEQLPDAYFGFPGVSPGFDIPKVRAGSDRFLAEADEAIRGADFVCMHTYWGADGTSYLNSLRKVREFCDKYRDKLILVSEFSNSAPNTGKDVKGREYAQFYTEARKLPANLGALFAFVLSAYADNTRRDFPGEVWVDSQIAQYVGGRPVT